MSAVVETGMCVTPSETRPGRPVTSDLQTHDHSAGRQAVLEIGLTQRAQCHGANTPASCNWLRPGRPDRKRVRFRTGIPAELRLSQGASCKQGDFKSWSTEARQTSDLRPSDG